MAKDTSSQAELWIVLWGCGLWFIVQRIIMAFAFYKCYKVKSIAKEELSSLKGNFKAGKDCAKYTNFFLLLFICGLASML